MTNYFSPIISSINFIFKYPRVLVLTAIKAGILKLLHVFIATTLLHYSAVRLHNELIAKYMQTFFSLFNETVYGIPYGIIILFVWFIASLLISVAIVDYVSTGLQQPQNVSVSRSIGVARQRLPNILFWGIVYSCVYFIILTVPFPNPLFILPWFVLITFFIPGTILNNSSISDTLIKSVQLMKNNFGKTKIFFISYIIALFILALGILQFAQDKFIIALILPLFAIINTIKDIFKAITMLQGGNS